MTPGGVEMVSGREMFSGKEGYERLGGVGRVILGTSALGIWFNVER